MTIVNLPFESGASVWQPSRNREITLLNAFMNGGRVTWVASYGDEKFMVHESDIRPVPRLEQPLQDGDRIKINKVPATVIRDAFPGLPGGKGVVARKIVEEREKNGAFTSVEDLSARMGLSQVDWNQVGIRVDFGG